MTPIAGTARSDTQKTKAQLLEEVGGLRARVAELERTGQEAARNEAAAQRLREAIEGFSDSIVLYDKDERVVFTNAKYHELYPNAPPKDEVVGLTQEQLLRRSLEAGLINDPLAKSDPEGWLDKRLEERREGRFVGGETTHSTGRTHMIRHWPTSDGGLIVSHTDITERKQVEDEAKRRLAQLRATVDSMPDGLLLLDENQNIIVFNALWRELFDFPEVLAREGENVANLIRYQAERGDFGEGQVDALVGEILGPFRSGEPFIYERELSSGRIVTVRGSPVPETGLVISYTDITDRKEAEAQLQQIRKRLDLALDGSGDGLWDYNMKTGDQYRDERYWRMLGYEQDEVDENFGSFEQLLHPDDAPIVKAAIDRSFRSGAPETYMIEFRMKSKSGDWVWILSRGKVSERDENGESVRVIGTHTDITERKKAEEELRAAKDQSDRSLAEVRKTQENLREILKQSPIGASIARTDTHRINFANSTLVRMLGCGQDGMLGRHVDEFWESPAARDEVTKEFMAVGHVSNCEIRLLRNDGTSFWCLASFLLCDFEGKSSSIAWFIDIDARKKAESALRDSEERVRSLVENMKGIAYRCLLDEAWTMTYIGGAVEEITGYPRSDFQDNAVRTFGDIIHPDDAEVVTREVEEAVAAHRDFTLEYRIRHRGGSYRWVMSIGQPILGPDGDLKWLDGTLFDITERKLAENRFKALLESAPDATVIVDAEGTIVETNQQSERLFGYRTEELVGQKVEIILPERFRERHPTHRGTYFTQAQVRPMGIGLELYGQARDGREFPIEISLSPIKTEEGTLVSAAVRDVTERKKAEGELRLAKDRAEAALADLTKTQARLVTVEKMASLGQLTAGIAHEIKNPLNFVTNFSETSVELLNELTEALEPVQDKFDQETHDDVDDIVETLKGDLQKINHHGRRADSIVKSMLLHARGDAVERVPTAVNELIEEAFGLAYHGERARDNSFQVTMEQNYDEAAGEAALLPQEITRVLVNLFSNAFYAVKNRVIDAKSGDYTPTVSVQTKDKGQEVEIRVRDNGTGIPEAVREKLFDPFFTTKPTGEGTGLGLSMSFDIIAQQHGGRIEVESEPGAYTEFTITLPRR